MRTHRSILRDLSRWLLLPACASLLSLAGCGGIDLDPTSHREVTKAPSVLTNPPPELRDGSAREDGTPTR